MAKRFTDRYVRSLVEPGEYRDAMLPGFGLRIRRNGAKRWFVRYRAAGGHRRKILGDVELVSLADARKAARALLGDISVGIDPMEERDGMTFSRLAGRYLETHAKRRKRTWREDARVIDGDLLPRWGGRPADSITRADVIELLDDVVDRGAPVMANRTRALVSKIYNWAIERDMLESNPVIGTRPPAPNRAGENVLSHSQLSQLWLECEVRGSMTAFAWQLLILTGQREQEVLGMRWSEIDGEWWDIPGERTKNRRAHRVYLAPAALTVLQRAGASVMAQREHVLLGPDGTSKLANTGTMRQRACKQLGFWWTLRDIRRTVASGMAEIGIPRHIREICLNHTPQGVHAVHYERFDYAHERADAWSRWAAHLLDIAGGGKGLGNVIPFSPHPSPPRSTG